MLAVINKQRIILALLMLIVIALLSPVIGYADNDSCSLGVKFCDVAIDHWAYEGISWMTEKGILNGYNDGSFKPDNAVSRSEFAKIMVLALDIKLNNPGKSTFIDVDKTHWVYKYAESAKYYLTGFRTNAGDMFKPDSPAVREDMAVALVKALGHEDEDTDESILEMFDDNDMLSSNLRKYVAKAVESEIMQGYLSDGGIKEFRPQNTLTRAEAAVLLFNTMKSNEEKVTYDEEKITYDKEEDYEDNENNEANTPMVQGRIENGKIILDWTKVQGHGFKYYKIVIAKNNPNPSYPNDGHLYCINNSNTTTVAIDTKNKYNNGDFGKYLTKGEKYYFSVTAVYNDIKIAGNSIQMKIPNY